MSHNDKLSNEFPTFGRSMRSQFLIENSYTPLNHGSYGTFPKRVREVLRHYQDRAEKSPDKWMHRDLAVEIQKAREEIASFVKADAKEVVFVQNTTTAINSVLKSLRYENGDKILFLSTIYKGVRSLMYFIRDTSNGKIGLIELEMTHPISDDELIQKIVKIIEEEERKPGTRIKAALIDAISSIPGIKIPFERIIPILRQHNILSVIDGAHAIGQIPLDLHILDPDFFATNCHKWLYAVRGCAILYVPVRNQRLTHHAITSSLLSLGFVDEFSWVGTQDFSSYLTVPAALEFRRKIGGEARIQEYCNKLAIQGGKIIAETLGTEIMGPEHNVTHMVNIRLPILASNPAFNGEDATKTLFDTYNCFLPIHQHGDWWYVRASAQIYTDITDFEYASSALAKICEPFLNSSKL